MDPLRFVPIFEKTLWANDRFAKFQGIEGAYGTIWQISAHPSAANRISGGEYDGQLLSTLLTSEPQKILGEVPREKFLRLCFLDAKEDLSIQVHPDEEYAQKIEQDHGKTEAWFVFWAKEKNRLVAGTSLKDKAALKAAIEKETLGKHLCYHKMEEGDFILIPAGELHALGGGLTVLEISTESNTTYRLYDYGRRDAAGNSRPLHLEKSFDVLDLDLNSEVVRANPQSDSIETLCDCEAFKAELLSIEEGLVLNTQNRFHDLVCVSGKLELKWDDKSMELNPCDAILIPASIGLYSLNGKGKVIRAMAGEVK